MPRILNVNTYHYRRGGSDAVYLDHAALLEQQGWESAFFAMSHPQNLPTPWSRFFIDELEFGGNYTLAQKLVMASKVVYSFEAQRKLRALLDVFPADIAHLHCFYHHHSPSILSTLAEAGVPIVMTAHDLKIACPAYKMLNHTGFCERCKDGSVLNVLRYRCIRNSYAASAVVMVESGLHRALDTYRKYLTTITVPSRFLLEKFVEWGWPRDRFVYIPNYVDATRFEPQYRPGEYFLYFGRLVTEKGVGTLLRAAKAAGVRLLIAGTGPDEAQMHALQQQLQGNVEFLGYRSGSSLAELVRGSRCVVLPSEVLENAPMSVLESFAFGKPVIGARIAGIPELVIDDQTGWTFESGNVDQLATLLARLASTASDQSIESAGRAARERVQAQFSKAGYVDAMLALYRGLMSPKPRA